MTGDLPAAALRLMASCTVRTHLRDESRRGRIYHSGQSRGEVIICGRKFASINEAARTLHRSDHTIRRWLAGEPGATLEIGPPRRHKRRNAKS